MASAYPPTKNTAFSFDLEVFDYSGKYLSGATFSAKQISKDGGSFATISNAPAEIGTSGTYTISLTSTEMNADRVKLRFVITSAPDIGGSLWTTLRRIDDLAFPTVSGRSLDVESTGEAGISLDNVKQATGATVLTNITIPVTTTLTNAPSDSSGVTTLLSRLSSARAGYLDLLNTNLDIVLSTVKTVVDAIKAKTDNLPASPAATGAQMDLVNVPNATAVTAIQAGLGTAASQTSILNKLGAITGSGVNTLLGYAQALARTDATLPSDFGGTFDPSTDSQQAIRDRGDAAWVTGSGSAPTVSQIADEVQTRTIAAVTAVDHVTNAVGSVTSPVTVTGTIPDSAGTTILVSLVTPTRARLLDNLAALAGITTSIKAMFQALARKDLTPNADIAGTHDPATDSEEALRDKLNTLTPTPPVNESVTITENS